MKLIKLKKLARKDYVRIVERSRGNYKRVTPAVKRIIKSVREGGDSELYKLSRRFYKQSLPSLQVSREELTLAYKAVNKDFVNAIKQMAKNIETVCRSQIPTRESNKIFTEVGISVWRSWKPIEKIGLYIPGGNAIYPSSVLMSAIPGIVAGCKEIILCTPPRDGTNIPSPTLVAADLVGIKKIFKVGGAEAIAAMTYGTETIPKVYKIFGAGNLYVTAAKILALEEAAIDMPAGPSEVFIVADKSANPKFIAADLLADAEHGEDSACVLISTDEKIVKETMYEINKQAKLLSTGVRALKSINKYGMFAVVNSLDEAINFVNDYAPEHLELMTENSDGLARKVNNAGSVFLGNWTCKASGDYATGANHVLPTGGMAKMYSALGVDSYGKWTEIQKCTKNGLKNIKQTIETVANVEELPAHKNSVSIRF